MGKLTGLQPEAVFRYFEELCGIPHGSRNTKQISDYCVEFAKQHNLRYIQDDLNNVILFKNGTKGYEASSPVILQGHLDMVCEKTAEATIDFTKDGLNLAVDGDYVYAEGTTLGGDDGIAVAYALALLDSKDIPHPPLEVLLTVDEEIGMLGAVGVDLSALQGKRLINIDSEEEGILLTSCAGGLTADCRLPLAFTEQENTKYKITVTGLAGGHSGVEIQKQRGNSNCLMGRLLYRIQKAMDFSIVSLEGGLKDNAIPRETTAVILVDEGDKGKLEACVRECEQHLKQEYKVTDSGIQVQLEALGTSKEKVFTKETANKAVFLLHNIPNGVQAMSADIPGLVETSLNFGILQMEEEVLSMRFSVRSSVKSAKYALTDRLISMIEFMGGICEIDGDYPAWEYKRDSALRNIMVDVYREQYGKDPEIQAIHAGLECGILCGKIQDLDCVSMGPDISDIHTTSERLSIHSVQRVWNYLLEILKRCK